MRNNLFLLLVISCISLTATAQQASEKIDTNKYRINLPDYWGKGHKVWNILIDRLPEICPELSNKDLCGDDCKTRYSVELYLTNPVIEDYKYTNYGTSVPSNTRPGSFNPVFDPTGKMVSLPMATMINLTQSGNKDVKMTLSSYYSFECYLLLVENNEKIITKMVLVDPTELWSKRKNFNNAYNNRPGIAPEQIIEKNKDEVTPTEKDLFNIVENKILALR